MNSLTDKYLWVENRFRDEFPEAKICLREFDHVLGDKRNIRILIYKGKYGKAFLIESVEQGGIHFLNSEEQQAEVAEMIAITRRFFDKYCQEATR